MDDMKQEMGKRIRSRRENLQLSQEELAIKLGYKSRSSINKIELGKTDLSQAKIQAFADVLDTTPSYLLGWEEEKVDRIAKGADGLIAILNDIYGQAEMSIIEGEYATCFYFPLDDKYALSEFNFDKLYELAKSSIKQLTDLLKIDRDLLYQDCLETANSDFDAIIKREKTNSAKQKD